MTGTAVQEWFSAAELAALALPGVPGSKRGVQVLADRLGWENSQDALRGPLARRRRGRGGGVEYHVSLLPELARAKLMQPRGEAAAPNQSRESAWARYDRLPDALKETARHRLQLLQRVETLVRGGLGKGRAIATVVEAEHRVAVAAGRKPEPSEQTLYGWFNLIAGVPVSDRLAFLAPAYCGRTETADCHPEVWRIFKSDYLRPRRGFAAAYRLAQDEAEKHGWPIPSGKTLQRRLRKEVHPMTVMLFREGEDAVKRQLPWVERDELTFHAMEAVNVDGHKWDVMVDFGDGKPTRPMMVAIQDVYSRKILGWRLALSENANAVRMAFVEVFQRYGIPRLCFFDNGRAFASKWLTGGTAHRFRFTVKEEDQIGLLTAFGVEVHFTTPYSGQSKPIERSFRDLEGEIGTSAAVQGAYVGNNPLNKPHDAGERVIPIAEFEEIVRVGIQRHNARLGRRTKACQGRLSLEQAFAASYAQSLIQVATDEQIRQALLCVEGVRVRPNGHGIQLAGNRYWADFMLELVGQKVAARFDPEDLHGGLHIYSLSGVYLGFAECLAKVGFANAEEGREALRLKRRLLKSIKERAAAEDALERHQLAALGPEFEPQEVERPRVLQPFFGGGSAAPRIDIEDDEEALERASNAFYRTAAQLRVVGEDD